MLSPGSTNPPTPTASGGLARVSSAVRLRPLSPNAATRSSIGSPMGPLSPAHGRTGSMPPTHTRTSSVASTLGPIAPAAVPVETFSSLLAPANLDEYIALQNQQSKRGLEVVYGLKVELSRLYEELLDRAPPDRAEVWGQPLPYRIMGIGGVLYWENLRQDAARKLAAGQAASIDPATALDQEPLDPFGTSLPTVARPPPPVSPETILPAYVLVDRLRGSVRRALADLEDQLEERAEQISVLQKQKLSLQSQLEEALTTGYMSPSPEAPILASSPRSSSLTQRKHRRGASKTVHYADDEFVSTALATTRESDAADGSETNRSNISSPRSSPSPALRPRSPSKSPRKPTQSGASALGAAAEAIWHRSASASNSLSSRVYNQQHSSESSRNHTARSGSQDGGGNDANMNSAREEALERTVQGLELALEKYRQTEQRLRQRLEEQSKSHSQELVELTSKLSQAQTFLTQTQTDLTHKSVLLNLESIARRQRQDQRLKLESHFTRELGFRERELRVLLDPQKELLFVRRAEPQLHIVEKGSARGGGQSTLTSQRSKSAKKKPAGPSGTITPALTEQEAKDAGTGGQQSSLISPAAASSSSLISPSSELYPSPASPLTALENSVKNPQAKQWLGKLLSPEKEPTKDKTIGHLLPGVDLLATDLLLVLDRLFHVEYDSFSKISVELSRSIQFETDLAAHHSFIKNAQERPDMYVDEPMKQSEPTTADLSALLASIHPTSLAYLQAIQKLFLALYNRLPYSLQHRFLDLSQKMTRVANLNEKYLKTIKQPVTSQEQEAKNLDDLLVRGGELEPAVQQKPGDISSTATSTDIVIPASDGSPSEASRPLPLDTSPSAFDDALRSHMTTMRSNTQSSGHGATTIANPNHSLARFELILHQIKAIASFRGVVLSM